MGPHPTPPPADSGESESITLSLDLVRRAQKGDNTSLNRLFNRYYDRIRRIVRLRLGKNLRSCLDSADILQDTFIAAINSFDCFEMRDEASLVNWLSKLAERQIIAAADYHGAKKRDHNREVPLPSSQSSRTWPDGGVQLADRGPQPLEELADAEQAHLVEECIQDLSEEYRELIILRNYAGAPWETVARETGRPTSAAARMMHARAMIELGKLVRNQGVD